MRLFVMRHGPAEAGSVTGRDFDRALSPSGRVTTEAIARELLRRGEVPDAIYASPLRRTRETAAIVASLIGGGAEPATRDELAPGEDGRVLVRSLLAEGGATLLVAHAPDVSDLASWLLGADVGGFEPAMIVGIDYDGGRGQRRFVLRPSELGG